MRMQVQEKHLVPTHNYFKIDLHSKILIKPTIFKRILILQMSPEIHIWVQEKPIKMIHPRNWITAHQENQNHKPSFNSQISTNSSQTSPMTAPTQLTTIRSVPWQVVAQPKSKSPTNSNPPKWCRRLQDR